MWRKPKSGTHREQSQLPQPCCPPIPKRGKAACHLKRGPRTSVRLNAAPARPPRWIVVSVRLTARDEPRSSTSRSHSNRPPAPSRGKAVTDASGHWLEPSLLRPRPHEHRLRDLPF